LRFLCLLTTLLLGVSTPLGAAEFLILESHHSTVLDQQVRLIQNSCGSDNHTLTMADYAEFDLGRIVREERPAVLIALGEKALKEARRQRQTPVVYAMTIAPREETLPAHVTGVSMTAPPESYLRLFRALEARRIGVVHDPDQSEPYLRRARAAAEQLGLEIVEVHVSSPRELVQRLSRFDRQAVDALWLLPDRTTVTGETVDAYFRYAQEKSLPVVAYAEAFLARGAVAAVEITPRDISRALCTRAGQLRSGTSPRSLGVLDPGPGRTLLNDAVARHLGIDTAKALQLTRSDRE
jgi:ABC-type uncharacterized transport system substrate-binding protein